MWVLRVYGGSIRWWCRQGQRTHPGHCLWAGATERNTVATKAMTMAMPKTKRFASAPRPHRLLLSYTPVGHPLPPFGSTSKHPKKALMLAWTPGRKPSVRVYLDLNGIVTPEHLVDTAVAAHLYAGREPPPPVGKGKFPGLLSIPIDTGLLGRGPKLLIVASHFQLDIRVACLVAPKDARLRNGQIGSPDRKPRCYARCGVNQINRACQFGDPDSSYEAHRDRTTCAGDGLLFLSLRAERSPCDESRPPEFVTSSHPQVVSD